MPLPDGQFGGMRILGLIPLLQLGLHRWLRHWDCCNCPGHQGFLSEGLWVSHTVLYHHNCLLPSLFQLCVCILYGEALQQRAVFIL